MEHGERSKERGAGKSEISKQTPEDRDRIPDARERRSERLRAAVDQ